MKVSSLVLIRGLLIDLKLVDQLFLSLTNSRLVPPYTQFTLRAFTSLILAPLLITTGVSHVYCGAIENDISSLLRYLMYTVALSRMTSAILCLRHICR